MHRLSWITSASSVACFSLSVCVMPDIGAVQCVCSSGISDTWMSVSVPGVVKEMDNRHYAVPLQRLHLPLGGDALTFAEHECLLQSAQIPSTPAHLPSWLPPRNDNKQADGHAQVRKCWRALCVERCSAMSPSPWPSLTA